MGHQVPPAAVFSLGAASEPRAQVPAPKEGVLGDKGQEKADKRLTGMELLP